MKLSNLKKMITLTAFGLVALFGTSQVANAQNNRQQTRKQQQQILKQQQKLAKQQQKIVRQQQKLENMQARRYRVYRNGSYYQTDDRGAELLRQAVNRGYQQGFRAGQSDRSGRRSSNYGISHVYRTGSYGYQSYVDSGQYRYYFQEGFRRGYEDGYNSRYRYGTNSSNGLNILGSILQSILNLQRF